jgi:alkylation response protein AidB-like acyl-CoA dehydrogenase
MNLGLTDDQQFFQETTRKFLEQQAPLTTVRALADDPDGFDRAWWAKAAELGWTSFLVPERDGGGSLSGEGVVDLAIVAEEMGRLVSPGPLVATNDELAEALTQLDSVAAEHAPRYERFAATYCDLDDGNAAARVVDRVFGAG